MMKGRGKRMVWYIVGGLAGAAAGYLYYRLVGCPNGTCPITSNPYVSSVYGAVMGLLIAAVFVK
jgi:hypothetical protein